MRHSVDLIPMDQWAVWGRARAAIVRSLQPTWWEPVGMPIEAARSARRSASSSSPSWPPRTSATSRSSPDKKPGPRRNANRVSMLG